MAARCPHMAPPTRTHGAGRMRCSSASNNGQVRLWNNAKAGGGVQGANSKGIEGAQMKRRTGTIRGDAHGERARQAALGGMPGGRTAAYSCMGSRGKGRGLKRGGEGWTRVGWRRRPGGAPAPVGRA